MIDGLLMIILGIFAFGILVFVHEFGHFIAAKVLGIKVEIFAIGFGPKIIGFTKGDTTYQISLFPMGGFCKFKGDDIIDTNPEALDKESFYGASPLRRTIVAFFGPFMNYLLAIVVLSIIAFGTHKEEYLPSKIVLVDDFTYNSEFYEETSAKKANIQTGDTILKINDRDINTFQDISKAMIYQKDNKNVKMIVDRNGENINIDITPKWSPEQMKPIIGIYSYIEPVVKYNPNNKLANYLEMENYDKIIGIDDDYEHITEAKISNYLFDNYGLKKRGILHIDRDGTTIDKEIDFEYLNIDIAKNELYFNYYLPIRTTNLYNPFLAIKSGFENSNEVIAISAIGLYSLIFKPKKNIGNQLGGPIMIGYLIGSSTLSNIKDNISKGIKTFFSLIAYISLALAFFILLPLPAVDGGHIILNLFELITKKRVNLKVVAIINMIGFFLLILLAIYIAGLDISKIVK
jgi:regulator of sigma E protease